MQDGIYFIYSVDFTSLCLNNLKNPFRYNFERQTSVVVIQLSRLYCSQRASDNGREGLIMMQRVLVLVMKLASRISSDRPPYLRLLKAYIQPQKKEEEEDKLM